MRYLWILILCSTGFTQCLGDMNGDGTKNVIDIVILVDDILAGDDNCEFDCTGLTEVELWGVYYDIESTAEINLGYQGLTGSIPPEIGCLTNLEYLGLYGNDLTGSIPPEIGNLTNLSYLNLSYNQLTGAIPPEIGNLTNLTGLYLHSNELTGDIPPEIGNLINLTGLSLHSNQLTGEIPPEVCDLIESNDLDISEILPGNNLIPCE